MPSATVDNTFGHETNVYRVADKIFALVNVEDDNCVTLKTLPEDGEALLAQYDFVRPGYYMNKRHWITIDLVPGVPMDEVRELIDDSYRLVFESLPRKGQAQLDPGLVT
jgi:predicted DNA-binding protein (MmcQ/YjbR family)